MLLRLSAPEVTMNTKGQARFLGQVAELWSCKQCADLGMDLAWPVNASL